MAVKIGYCALRWRNPELEPALAELKKIGWDGWECRLSLDWLGTPRRLRQICDNAEMPVAILAANGTPEDLSWENVERNKRRMEYAAELEADCFMFMNRGRPDTVTEDDVIASAAAAESWAEYAAQFNLEVSYHIHTNCLVDSIQDWQLYMSRLDKTKLCIDVSHSQLWGYDPVDSIQDFQSQLNYIHLQDYSSTSIDADGKHQPAWVSVGLSESVDFPAVMKTLETIGFDRWVTCCPGQPIPGQEDVMSEVQYSRQMREYMQSLGY